MSDGDFPKQVVITVHPPARRGGKAHCRVEPSIAPVHYGGRVTFRAAEGCGPLTVLVPTRRGGRKVFPALFGQHFTVEAGSGKAFGVLSEKHRTREPREYPYAVYCHAHNCFAMGSLPKMMVGP